MPTATSKYGSAESNTSVDTEPTLASNAPVVVPVKSILLF